MPLLNSEQITRRLREESFRPNKKFPLSNLKNGTVATVVAISNHHMKRPKIPIIAYMYIGICVISCDDCYRPFATDTVV